MADLINRSTGYSKRTSARTIDTSDFHPGPYEAEVVNHLDPSYMGGLEVRLLTKSRSGDDVDTPGQTVPVRYLSPFYGVTPNSGLTKNSGYDNTQKSYGMWFVPPDIGTRVLVIFAEGGQGYWIGCIQDEYMNMMVPAYVPATEFNEAGDKLPVAEYNKKIEEGTGTDPTQYIKPVNTREHEILKEQGLDKCDFRGLTSSSARREIPSAVFGISTPGPLDQEGPKVKYGGEYGGIEVPFSRLGGSSLVFDDGDKTLLRKKHAKDGPPEYANVDKGETDGDPKIPFNELVRIRTRTGHQILLHNSEDLIYIANSRGTAWIEMTSKGKIDIYTKEDVSVGADRDINFHAKRDIHIEADENIHVKAGKSMYTETDEEYHVKSNEKMFFHAVEDYHFKCDENGFIEFAEDLHNKSKNRFLEAEKDVNTWIGGKLTVDTDGEISVKSSKEISTKSEKSIYVETEEQLHTLARDQILLTAGGSIEHSTGVNRFAGVIVGVLAPGSGAASAEEAPVTDAERTEEPENAESADESPRVPEHEPWDKHEHLHEEKPKPIPDTYKKGQ